MKKISSLAITFLIFASLAVGSFAMSPRAAHAQFVPTGVMIDTSPTSVSRTKDSLAQWAKSFTLDRLAYIAAKQILRQMTVATINWINSGFNGSPAFITNPGDFFLDAADQVTGAFLAKSGPLQSLCSPWSIDVRLSLALGIAGNSGNFGYNRYTCTLNTIIGNAGNASINGFTAGDFSQGGWPAFIAMTTEVQNNPYGSYLEADSDLFRAIGMRQSSISQDLIESGGFLSWQSCAAVTVSENDPGGIGDYGMLINGTQGSITKQADGSYQRCSKQTPGSVIAGTLMPQLNDPTVQLELANDINSVVSALATQMMSQLLNKGLNALSHSGSDTYSQGSYVNQLYNEATAAQSVSTLPGYTTNSGSTISTYDRALSAVGDSRNRYLTAQACFANKQNSSLLDPGQRSFAASQSALISNTLATRVNPLVSDLTAKRNALAPDGTLAIPTTVSIPGSTNADDVTANLQLQIQNYETQVTNAAATISNDTSNISTASSDLANAQSQVTTFNSDAASYQTSCDALP